MSRVLLLLAIGLPTLASAQDGTYFSEPAALTFQDEFDAFQAIEFDTGSLPSGSPLAVRFYIKSWGNSYASLDADSELSWPDALTQTVISVPDTGFLDVYCDLDMAAQVTFDLWGYKGAYDVWSQRLKLRADTTFDGLLLDGARPRRAEVVADGEGLAPWSTDVPLFAGLELRFVVAVFPRATGSVQGDRIETNDTVITRDGGTAQHEVPVEDPGLLELTSTYYAQVGASLSVIIQPQLEICAPILGCFRVARFDIPVPLVDDQLERAFEPVDYSHPLPAMASPIVNHDFGDVEVGSLVNLQLPLSNMGLLDLEGWLSIEGDDSFSVYPAYIHATQGNTDGTVVTFAPSDSGASTAVLVVTSNDPSRGELRIPLLGNGWVEGDDRDGQDIPNISGEVGGCGCTTTPTAPATGWLLGLGLLGLLWRRRS